MPADAEEAELFELSLFMLEGELDTVLGDEAVPIAKGDALHIRRGVPFGVTNSGSGPASFVLSFSPPPPNVDLATMKQAAIDRGRVVIEASDVEGVVGALSFPEAAS